MEQYLITLCFSVAAGENKSAHSAVTRNTRKIEEETEQFKRRIAVCTLDRRIFYVLH
jgi:hypothetical protein